MQGIAVVAALAAVGWKAVTDAVWRERIIEIETGAVTYCGGMVGSIRDKLTGLRLVKSRIASAVCDA